MPLRTSRTVRGAAIQGRSTRQPRATERPCVSGWRTRPGGAPDIGRCGGEEDRVSTIQGEIDAVHAAIAKLEQDTYRLGERAGQERHNAVTKHKMVLEAVAELGKALMDTERSDFLYKDLVRLARKASDVLSCEAPAPVTWERSSRHEAPPVYPGCWVRVDTGRIGYRLPESFDPDSLAHLYALEPLGTVDGALTSLTLGTIVAVGPTRESVEAPKKPEPLTEGDEVMVSLDLGSAEALGVVKATFDDKVVVAYRDGIHVVHRSNVRRAK